jgi:deoxyribonuclease-2
MRFLSLLTLIVVASASGRLTAAEMGAIGDNGQPVDWWFIYKIPELGGDANGQGGASGLEYMYYDAKSGGLKQSPHRLLDGKGALDLTLKSIMNHPDATTGWILYNDEMPASLNRKDNGALGHTKGVVGFDAESKTAFWLLHSWPKFPDRNPNGARPALNFGQTFLCLSLDIATASKIAAQMANHQEPQVYDSKVPAGTAAADPLKLLTEPLNPNATGDSNVIDGKTRGGLAFKVIAKNRKWGKDFWNDLVGPTLSDDMDVETWIRGKIAPVLDSDGIHKTFDIKFVDMHPSQALFAWPEHNDHAKWGITKTLKFVNVGDMNRMVSQETRGGGTIAFVEPRLWEALKKTETIIAPPGHTKEQATNRLKATHVPANSR